MRCPACEQFTLVFSTQVQPSGFDKNIIFRVKCSNFHCDHKQTFMISVQDLIELKSELQTILDREGLE